jgi:hypothetical protein
MEKENITSTARYENIDTLYVNKKVFYYYYYYYYYYYLLTYLLT